jgi:hypothetical protein
MIPTRLQRDLRVTVERASLPLAAAADRLDASVAA